MAVLSHVVSHYPKKQFYISERDFEVVLTSYYSSLSLHITRLMKLRSLSLSDIRQKYLGYNNV